MGIGRGQQGAFAVRRRTRRPRRPLVLRAVVGVAAAAALAALGWWLLTSPVFAVKRVETGAYRFTSATALESALGGLLGRNIWRVGRADAEAALATLPWVHEVRITRRLPATVGIEFTEWRPLVAVSPADPRPGDPDLHPGQRGQGRLGVGAAHAPDVAAQQAAEEIGRAHV